MAWVDLRVTDWNRTKLQLSMMSLINDPSVRIGINNIISDLMIPYVPLDSGAFQSRNAGDYPGRLRNSVKATFEGLEWRTPYAEYVYYGEIYRPNIPIHAKGSKELVGFYSPPSKFPTGEAMSYSTPGTGKFWYQLFMAQQKQRVNINVTNYLKAECKRRGLS